MNLESVLADLILLRRRLAQMWFSFVKQGRLDWYQLLEGQSCLNSSLMVLHERFRLCQTFGRSSCSFPRAFQIYRLKLHQWNGWISVTCFDQSPLSTESELRLQLQSHSRCWKRHQFQNTIMQWVFEHLTGLFGCRLRLAFKFEASPLSPALFQ